jgi:hypothetical protein
LALARITGRDQVAKARFAGRSEPYSPPLGDPYEWIACPLQIAAWNDFRRQIPWLRQADGVLVMIASVIRAKLASGTATIKEMNLLRMCLGSMGAVPTSNLAMPPADEDPDDALFNRYN